MKCKWKSQDEKKQCGRNTFGDSEFCIFHKPGKAGQEATLFWDLINFDPFNSLSTESKFILSHTFSFEGETSYLKHFVKIGFIALHLPTQNVMAIDAELGSSISRYLNSISRSKTYQDEVYNLWKESGLHGGRSGFFEGFVFPASGGSFHYKYLLLNQICTFFFVEAVFEGRCWFEGYDFGNNNVQFSNVKIENEVSFENTIFHRNVTFNNVTLGTHRSIAGRYPFSNATFLGQELKFIGGSLDNIYGIKLSENTNILLEQVEISDVRFGEFGEDIINAKEETFRIAKQQATRRGHYKIAGYYYYEEKEAMRKDMFNKFRMEHRKRNCIKGNISYYSYLTSIHSYTFLWNYLWVLLSKLVLGYGEKPIRALIASIALMFIYGIMYHLCGLLCSQQTLTLFSSIFFSVVTFTTVGYGDITPKPGWGHFIASTEMFLGVTFIALWTATLVRKMTR